jgi:4-amino-4-deoxy-L-arabinose transferase-like glycosyltransferase
MRLSMTKLLFLLLLIGVVAFSFGNAGRALDKIQESRVAETAREMVISQQWMLPHFNGELRLQKPPLTYWTTALSFHSLGIHEFSLRLPSLLFGLATIAIIFIWLSRRVDKQTGFVAALILLSSFIGMRYFRSAEADATLIFFITLSLMTFDNLSQVTTPSQRKAWGRLMMLSVGLAFLTKGPAGIAIPALSAILWGWRREDLGFKTVLSDGIAWALLIITAFAWYLWIIFAMPDIASQFFNKQLDETFISGSHQQPIYWYLLHAVEFFSPWGILILPAIWFYWRLRTDHSLIRLAMTWLMVVFVLLTLTVNKQTQYALLLLPPVSILLAYYFVHATQVWQRIHRWIGLLLALIVVVLFTNIVWRQGSSLSIISLGAFFLLPFVVFKFWQIRLMDSLLSVALVWALSSSTIYLLVEQYFNNSEEKQDIKQLAQQSKQLRPMLQFSPGNGAISFYSGDIVPEITHQQLEAKLHDAQPIWVFAKSTAKFDGLEASREMQKGSWCIWQVAQ